MDQLIRNTRLFLTEDEGGIESWILITVAAVVIIGSTTEIGFALDSMFASIFAQLASALHW